MITVFMRSLTEHRDGKLIAVIVSSYDGDGAAAQCGIKEVGGITIAQKPDTAGQPDMPISELRTHCRERRKGMAITRKTGAFIKNREGSL